MPDAPRTPYPPEPDGDDELLDATHEDVDWSNRREVRFSMRRVEVLRGRLTGAQLPEGTLMDVTFADCRADLVSFRFAKLERVVFRDCRLEEADFGGAHLESVTFERCPLVRGSFSGAKVKEVELRGCDLESVSGAAGLRGAAMPFGDTLANVLVLAAAAGIRVLDE